MRHSGLEADALDAARETERAGDRVRIGAADLLDGATLGLGEILVPAEPLEDPVVELGVSVPELGADRVGALGQQADAFAFDAEAGAERAAAILHMKVGVVELVRA